MSVTVEPDPDGRSRTCTLTAPARPEAIGGIHDMFDQLWSAEPELTDGDRVKFEGAVIEIANNIVEHAVVPAHLTEVTIDLTVTCRTARLSADFLDNGGPAPIDLTVQAMPDWTAQDGRGLALVQAMTDELHYERLADGNRWSLTCLRAP